MALEQDDTPRFLAFVEPERTIVTDRRRASDQPHPDQIAECVGVAEFYGVNLGPHGPDAIRRVLCAAMAWSARRDALELQHSRLRDRVDVWKSERPAVEAGTV